MLHPIVCHDVEIIIVRVVQDADPVAGEAESMVSQRECVVDSTYRSSRLLLCKELLLREFSNRERELPEPSLLQLAVLGSPERNRTRPGA